MNQLATGNSAVDNAEWNAALRASALVNRESSVVSEAGLNPLKAIPNNLLYTGILPSIPRQDLIRQLADWMGIRGPAGLGGERI